MATTVEPCRVPKMGIERRRGPPHIKKVGQVGQLPYFIGFFAGVNLANLTNFTRSRLIINRARFHSNRHLFS